MLVTEKSLRNVIDLTSVNDLLADLPGFLLFGMDQVLTYLMDPTIFSLSFNKEPGKGYLYGLDIAKQRRRLHNSLPAMYRKPLMISRLQAHSLCDSVLQCFFVGSRSVQSFGSVRVQSFGRGQCTSGELRD